MSAVDDLKVALVAVLGAEGYIIKASGYSRPTPLLVYSDLSTTAQEHVRKLLGWEPKAPPRPEPGKKATALAPEYLAAVAKSAGNLAKT